VLVIMRLDPRFHVFPLRAPHCAFCAFGCGLLFEVWSFLFLLLFSCGMFSLYLFILIHNKNERFFPMLLWYQIYKIPAWCWYQNSFLFSDTRPVVLFWYFWTFTSLVLVRSPQLIFGRYILDTETCIKVIQGWYCLSSYETDLFLVTNVDLDAGYQTNIGFLSF
jgi:hypothetical protein